MIDRDARGKITVAGSDRASYLHGLLSNDIQALTPGTGTYATYLTPQGRMISDMRVLELGDLILLDVAPHVKDGVLQRFDQFLFSEDVQLGDVTGSFGQIGVVGPQAAAVVSRALEDEALVGEISSSQLYQNRRTVFEGEAVILVRDDGLGVQGVDLYIARAHGQGLRDALRRAGAIEIGADVEEVLRVEAGRPLFGADMDEGTIPLEAGIEDRAISFTKGCYVGQEVIIRILHRGHGRVARKLVGLTVEGDEPPSPRDAIQTGDRNVGHVTSGVLSPAVGGPIGLGYVHRDFIAPGSAIDIIHGGARVPAVVTRLPFVGATEGTAF